MQMLRASVQGGDMTTRPTGDKGHKGVLCFIKATCESKAETPKHPECH